MIDGIALREGRPGIPAVNGAARRVGEVLDSPMSGALEDIEERYEFVERLLTHLGANAGAAAALAG